MSEIKITCPDCSRSITVKINTIDTLRAELESMTKDRDYYKSKLAALECMNRTGMSESENDLFNTLFGGLKK